jgi:hypothetical protein
VKRFFVIMSILIGLVVLMNVLGLVAGRLAFIGGVLRTVVLRESNSKKCETTMLFDDVSQVILSPERDKCLFRRENEVFIMDTRTEEILYKGNLKTAKWEITDLDWLNDEELIAVMKVFPSNRFEKHKTKDLVNYNFSYAYHDGIKLRFSNSYTKRIFQDSKDKKIIVQYESGEIWDTGSFFNFQHIVGLKMIGM